MSTTSSRTAKIRPEQRLDARDRRERLLNAAASLVRSGPIEAVTMEAVAEQAGVSRTLVYKHFSNRSALLGALYERESLELHRQLAHDVADAGDLESMLRSLVAGVFESQRRRGAIFAALHAAQARGERQREIQRRRDAATLKFFADRATIEFKIEPDQARALLSVALGTIPALISRWRTRPTAERARKLEDLYVALVIGGLRELASRRR